MKKILFTLLVLISMHSKSIFAQLPNGSIAPDFTVTDINGNSHNLYTLLNQGKTVYLDFFATWCSICWNYHQGHALQDLHTQYGPTGTNEAFVIAIEGDASTPLGCITAASCTGQSTQGNWTNGVTYPVCDNSTVNGQYQVPGFPTIYCICPNKKIYNVGRVSTAQLWAARNANCALTTAPIIASVQSTTNVRCKNTSSGAINLTVTGGTGTFTYSWSSGQTTQNLTNIPAGIYNCTITSGSETTTVGPINVNAPVNALTSSILVNNNITCLGNGSISASASGGWSGYSYAWSPNGTGQNITVTAPATYTVTVTDANGCTSSATQTMSAAVPPTASIATASTISCTNTQVVLNGSSSSTGANISYLWTTTGGTILSGASTNSATVSAAGLYTLRVTNTNNGCTATANMQVNSNTTVPMITASVSNPLTCSSNTATLTGTSNQPNSTFFWTGPGGFTSSLASVTVSITGSYTLLVTNPTNGCNASTILQVVSQVAQPTVSIVAQPITCTNPSTTLTANSSTTTNTQYAWSGPNSFTANTPSFSTQIAGVYTVIVTETSSGCTASATQTVTTNTTQPSAIIATAANLNCLNSQISLNGAASSQGPVYSYQWSGPGGTAIVGSNTLTPFVSAPGTYNLLVTNTSNGCTNSASVAVSQSPTVGLTLQVQSPILCNGLANGSLNATPTGGVGAFTYLWSTGQNTQTIYNLPTGNYRLTVSDSEGCTAWAAMSLTQPTPLAVNATATAQTQAGVNNGVATANPSGGVPPYVYVWSTNENTASIQNLAPGPYTVTVYDVNSCTKVQTVNVIGLNCTIDAIITNRTSPQCFGQANGSATVIVTGALAQYNVNWSNGLNAQNLIATNLAAGNYSVTVGDATGCQDVETFTITQPNSVVLTVTTTNQTFTGLNNGTATANPNGGTAPYTYLWSNNATTKSIQNLAPGQYTVTITDVNGCSIAQTGSVGAFSCSLNAQISNVNNASCFGLANGSATLTIAGALPNYNFSWSNGQNGQSEFALGLAAGTYSVTASDGSGCQDVETFTITQPDTLIMTASSTPQTVVGVNNGSATAIVSNATSAITYSWSNGQNTQTISNLPPGTYTVTASNANFCTVSQSVVVGSAACVLTANVLTTAVSCIGGNNGTAGINVENTNGNVVVQWSTGSNSTQISNLTAGGYSVSVSDGSGCQVIQNFEITQPTTNFSILVLNQNNTSCSTDNNGSATVMATGGQYTYAWSNGAIGNTATNLTANSYTVTATNSSGCTASQTVLILAIDNVVPTITCPANLVRCQDQSAQILPIPTVSDNCSTILTISSNAPATLPVGVNTIIYTTKDDAQNSATCSFTVEISSPIVVGNSEITGCLQNCEGQVSLQNISGGTAPYTFEWSNGQLGLIANNLCGTGLTVSCVDANLCRTPLTINMTTQPLLVINTQTIVNDANSQQIGSISINIVGGLPPYTYQWKKDGVDFANTEDLTGLGFGSYVLEVTDGNGCVISSQSIVIQDIVGTNEPIWAKNLQIIPNPTDRWLTILLSENNLSTLQIKIIDAQGKKLFQTIETGKNTVDVDMNNFASGIYFLMMADGKEVVTRKIIKN
jgi:large repetitive protein